MCQYLRHETSDEGTALQDQTGKHRLSSSCSNDSAGGPSSLSRLLKRARAELAGGMERT